MGIPQKIKARLKYLYQYHIRKEPFLLEAARWFKDKGDETYRLNYPLTKNSVVFDIGGYLGDFAADIHERCGCKVYVFEPVPEFFEKCVERFNGNPNIVCLNYGLSSENGRLNIFLADNATSLVSSQSLGESQKVELRSVVECIRELGLDWIDLLKINIEGGEFDVLPALIKTGEIKKIEHLQIQFHNFVESATTRRAEIRKQLADTHVERWNYEFVWESWQLNGDSP